MTLILLSFILLIFLLLVGVPVPFAFIGTILLFVFGADYNPSFLVPYGYAKMNNVVILAIPLFIMAGGLVNRSNVGDKIIKIVELFIGHLHSGLGAMAVISCGLFSSLTGSACATLSAIGSIMFPRLDAAKYPRGHSAALLASSSVLGLLFPPSAIQILYAWSGQVSVLACFLAIVFPGIILGVLLCLTNAFLLRNNKEILSTKRVPRDQFPKELARRTWAGLPALSLPFLVLGGIYGGFVTPTEAAALSALWVLPLGFFIYRGGLTIRNVMEELKDAVITTGAIMIMFYCIMILSRIYITENLPTHILETMTAISSNKLMILLMINIFMVIVGMLMDDVSGVLLITPLLIPIVIKLGVSPVHFAAVVGVNLGMGNITPPTAPLIYLAAQLNGARPGDTFRPTFWLILFAWLPTLLLTTYIPQLSLWLPNTVLGRSF